MRSYSLIMHPFILAFLWIFYTHIYPAPAALGAYPGNAWSAAIGCSDQPRQLSVSCLLISQSGHAGPAEWQGCEPITFRHLFRAERRTAAAAFVHCTLAAPRSRQKNPRPLLAADGRDTVILSSLPSSGFLVSLPQPASPWQPLVSSCWPCRPRRSWLSRPFIFGSSSKTEVSPTSHNK